MLNEKKERANRRSSLGVQQQQQHYKLDRRPLGEQTKVETDGTQALVCTHRPNWIILNVVMSLMADGRRQNTERESVKGVNIESSFFRMLRASTSNFVTCNLYTPGAQPIYVIFFSFNESSIFPRRGRNVNSLVCSVICLAWHRLKWIQKWQALIWLQ